MKIASTSTDLGQSVDSSGVAADEPATLAPKRLDDELEEAQTEVEKEDGEENEVSQREKAVAHYRQQLATVKNKLNGLSQEWKLKEEGLAVDPNSEGARGQVWSLMQFLIRSPSLCVFLPGKLNFGLFGISKLKIHVVKFTQIFSFRRTTSPQELLSNWEIVICQFCIDKGLL